MLKVKKAAPPVARTPTTAQYLDEAAASGRPITLRNARRRRLSADIKA